MSSRAKKFAQLPGTKRNAEGVKVCCWCGGALSGRQQRWCSRVCVDDYLARSSQTGLRAAVAKRDRGVCAGCGFQAERVERILNLLAGIVKTELNRRYEPVGADEPGATLAGYINDQPHYGSRLVHDKHPASARRREQLLLAIDLVNLWAGRTVVRWHGGQQVSTRTLWEADHIVPLAEGGAPGPENARTMCLRCHKAETAALAGRLAAARRPQLALVLTSRAVEDNT